MRTLAISIGIITALLIASLPAQAWEFSLKGEFEGRYRYVARTGPNDLFGNAPDAQARPLPSSVWEFSRSLCGLAGPNTRFVQTEGYSAKGSDSGFHEQRLWIWPRFDITKAVVLRAFITFSGNLNGEYARGILRPPVQGVYPNAFVGPSENWGTNPHYSGWYMPESRDIVNGVGIAVPVLQAAWVRMETPWGSLVYGRRPAGFGLGWVVHEKDTYATGLSLIAPYGPFTFVFSQYPHDSGQDTDPNDESNQLNPFYRGLGVFFGVTPLVPYSVASAVDKNLVIDWNQAFAWMYRAGNLDIGSMLRIVRWSRVHSLPTYPGDFRWILAHDDMLAPAIAGFFNPIPTVLGNTSVFLGANSPAGLPIHGDLSFLMLSSYLRWFDGRRFLNVEYNIQNVAVTRSGGRPISGRPMAWAAEGGFIAGPLKFAVAHFYRSGHDRRGGVFNVWGPLGTIFPVSPFGAAGQAYDGWNYFLTRWGGGQGPIEPYNFLIGIYGTGNSSFDSAGHCTYNDFLAYAARIDYAVAANLNLFASFIHGERASNTGTPVGIFTGLSTLDRDRGRVPTALPSAYLVVPNVPDNDLGWEVDVGFDWKILEGVTFKFLFARWQPGNWFKWAYQDRSRFDFHYYQNGGIDWAGLQIINPARRIDPIIAVQTGFLVEF